MAQIDRKLAVPAPLFSRRNFLLLGASLAVLAAGYAVLMSGHASGAAVLLVIGYCILFPLALIL